MLFRSVTHANRYEPELNRTTAEFAAHYRTVILPARPRKPQDKAYASYCTLCGGLNGSKSWWDAAVASCGPFDDAYRPEGFV